MKKASIKMSILIPSLAVLIAGIIGMVAVVGILSSNTANNLTNLLIDARVNEYSNEFRVLCGDVYGVVTATTQIVANYIDPKFVAGVDDPRGDVVDILSKAMTSSDNILGMWTCWEPNAFDGKDAEFADKDFYDASGRFIPYVVKSGNGFLLDGLVDYDSPVDGEYYQGPRGTGKPYITDPYVYAIDGVDTVLYTISAPILKDGKVAGAVGADIILENAITRMNAGSILDDGYIFTLSPSGLFATHPNKDILMNRYNTTWMKDYSTEVEDTLKNGGSFNLRAYSDVTNSDVVFLGSSVVIGDTGRNWIICGMVPEKTVNASSSTLLWTIIAIGLVLIAVVGVTIFIIVRGRLKDLPILTATAETIAIGGVDTADMDTGTGATKNEITLLGRAFSKMTEGIRQQADILSQISLGDYSVSVPVRSDKDVMNQAINQMLKSTNDTLVQINSASNQVSSGSKQIADGAQMLAQGATEQAATVEQLSASIAEVASNTSQNADMAREASNLSDAVKQNAEKGSAQMEQMMQAVKEINEASSSISKVIKAIDDIAFQTNILALNAAVEAARAGQHGKGFAVVADEVRNLAAKSAEAAKDTGVLIENSIEKANLGFGIAGETSTSLKDIVDGINRSAEIVTRIAQSSGDQESAISMINTAIDQVAQVVQQNSATAEESAAASEELSGQSSLMEGLVAQFKLKGSGQSLSHSSLGDSHQRMSVTRDETSFTLNEGQNKY